MAARASKTNTRGYRDAEGTFFASKAEWNRWVFLQGEQAAGRITDLERQMSFPIFINRVLVGGYRADACYRVPDDSQFAPTWTTVVEDVKGYGGVARWPFRKKVIEAACGFQILEVPAREWSDRAVARREKEAAMASYLSWQGQPGEGLHEVVMNGLESYAAKFGQEAVEVLLPSGVGLPPAGPIIFRMVGWLRVPNEAKRQPWVVLVGPVPEGAG